MYNYCIDGSLAILCPSVTSLLVTDNEKVVTVALVRVRARHWPHYSLWLQ